MKEILESLFYLLVIIIMLALIIIPISLTALYIENNFISIILMLIYGSILGVCFKKFYSKM